MGRSLSKSTRYPLPLTARQSDTLVADKSHIALPQANDRFMRLGYSGHALNIGYSGKP
jgi:hypothetical protein